MNDRIALKEFHVKHNETDYFVYDSVRSGAVGAIMDTWNDDDQVELTNPKVIFDFGAHVGTWSFYMAKKYPAAQVVAFEPNPPTYLALTHGIVRNDLKNVHPIDIAVSDRPLTIRYHQSNTGAASAYVPGDEVFEDVTVKTMTLNQIFEKFPEHVDLMKLDIEGAEYQIFHDFKYWDRIGAMTIEFHPWPMFNGKKNQALITDALVDLLHANMGQRPVKYTYPELHDGDYSSVVASLKETDKFIKEDDERMASCVQESHIG